MITSFFPGRVRLRAPVFKDAELTNTAISILKQFPAVKKIEYNPVTGSILLLYNPLKVPIEKIKPLIPVLKKLQHEADSYYEEKKPLILLLLKELEKEITKWDAYF